MNNTNRKLYRYWQDDKAHKWIQIDEGVDVPKSALYSTILETTHDGAEDAYLQDLEYRGDPYFDWDVKIDRGETILDAADAVKRTLAKLQEHGANPLAVRLYATGGRGFHAEIPRAMFLESKAEQEASRLHLPAIYKAMAAEVITDQMDMAVYSGNKGRQWRMPNVQRENGNYKVPITVEELDSMTRESYEALTKGSREVTWEAPEFSSKLLLLFRQSEQKVIGIQKKRPKASTLTSHEAMHLSGDKLKFEVVKRHALSQIESLLKDWLPDGHWEGDHYVARNPCRNDKKPGSFMVWANGSWKDFAEVKVWGSDLVSLYAYLQFNDKQLDARFKLTCDLNLDVDKEAARLKAVAMVEDAKARGMPFTDERANTYTATSLLARDIKPPKQIIGGLLFEGVTLLSAAPKMGKSLLALDFALCVAGGVTTLNCFHAHKGAVLFLTPDDPSPRRLQQRITEIASRRGVPSEALDHFEYREAVSRLGEGFIESLRTWLDTHRDTARLIVLDSLGHVLPMSKGSGNVYLDQLKAMSAIRDLSHGYGVSVLIVHHIKKGEYGTDWTQATSGSNGLSGGADAVWMLARERGQDVASLRITGRDADEQDIGLKKDGILWQFAGDGAEMRLNNERLQVIQLLRKENTGMSAADVAAALNRGKDGTYRLLKRMTADGDLSVRKAGNASLYSLIA